MRKKIIISVSVTILLVLFLGGMWAAKRRITARIPDVPTTQAQEPGGTFGLRGYAQRAFADGRTSTALIVSGSGMASSLDEAIADYGLAVGELMMQESVWYESADQILTWYKFRITETLTTKPYITCPDCTFDPAPPPGLLPLQSGEILVAFTGGSASIDNVIVETILEGFPGLVAGQRYLLFLNLNSTNQVGDVLIGPQGIVHINTDNTFAPVMQLAPGTTEPIMNGLATQYGNSLTQLRATLNPPAPCDPVQQQACEDEGGTWRSSTCFCAPIFDPCIRKPWLCE